MAFNFCVTQNGNVLSLESPAGAEHIRVGVFMEGYTICDHTLGLRYWDLGAYSPNGTFTAPTITAAPSIKFVECSSLGRSGAVRRRRSRLS
jgi:hypothetical protein